VRVTLVHSLSPRATRAAAPWGSPCPPPECAPREHSGQTAGAQRHLTPHRADSQSSRFPVGRLPPPGRQRDRVVNPGATDPISDSPMVGRFSAPAATDSPRVIPEIWSASSSWKWWPGAESNHRHADFQYDGERGSARPSRRPARIFAPTDRTARPDRTYPGPDPWGPAPAAPNPTRFSRLRAPGPNRFRTRELKPGLATGTHRRVAATGSIMCRSHRCRAVDSAERHRDISRLCLFARLDGAAPLRAPVLGVKPRDIGRQRNDWRRTVSALRLRPTGGMFALVKQT